jgi:tetratricopeptide (TPR) repeat protein
LWNAIAGTLPDKVFDHPAGVEAVAFSPDGTSILTGCRDGKARLWNAATAAPFGPVFDYRQPIYAVAFSPDGRKVLTGGWSDCARLWDARTGHLIRSFQHRDRPVRALTFSPDGRIIVTGGADGVAQLWNAATGEPMVKLLQHSTEVKALAFSPDGRTIVTGGADGVAQLWNAATGEPVGKPLEHPGTVLAVAFSPDGQVVLTGCHDLNARFWAVPSGIPLGYPLKHASDGVAFSPDGKTTLAGVEGHRAQFWEAPSPIEGGVDHVRLWANVLTTMRLDENGAFRVLDIEPWQECRRRLEELGGPPLPSAVGDSDWYLARECEDTKDWRAAASHLSRLIDTQPEEGPLHERRGNAYFNLGLWDKAIVDLEKALESGAKEHDLEGTAFRLAGLQAQLGDADGYRRTCADLLGRFVQTKNPRNAYLLARICLLAPDGVTDRAIPVRLSERALTANPEYGWYLHTLALADYRDGRFDKAINLAQRSMETDPLWAAHIVNWLVLSMAHHRLDHAEEAHQWLDKARREMPTDPAGVLPLHWHDRIACQLLLREAEGVLKENHRGSH